ncbi:EamA-like transporter family protein [Acinetobacter calcoaceticus]|uniref:EamA-like transporter family protein n=1 Tax=Acinetobacter calcoaceticus TaxID=471 RepID=A0A4R1XC11_ACICA|nr:EamA-like transporter family protein [Acinetobacter calcoaceticus]
MNATLANRLSIITFVSLWGSAAIFSKWGLQYANAVALLSFRYLIAIIALIAFCIIKKQSFLPQSTSWRYVCMTGFLLIGGYSLFYFLALQYGISPGLLATVLALQPILTYFITERSFSKLKLLGLLLSFAGIICLVYTSLFVNQLSILAISFALICLCAITIGAMLQRKIVEDPLKILPLQYLTSLVVFVAVIPLQGFHFEMSFDFWTPTIWLALVISVAAQLIFYRLLRSGNLVNVTSLFYLVPIVTLILDFMIFQATLSRFDVIGISAILLGVYLVYRQPSSKISA